VVYEGFLSFLKGTALAMLWGANAWPLISVPQLPALVTVVALIVCQSTVMAVGQACMKHKVLAPASTGPADFECALRVQQNTLEQLVFFCPRSVGSPCDQRSLGLFAWFHLGGCPHRLWRGLSDLAD
jgi:hypothetical protein